MSNNKIDKAKAMQDNINDDPDIIPTSIDAEKAILGAILLDDCLLDEVKDSLKLDHFYVKSHRIIYQAMLRIASEGLAIDTISIQSRLADDKDLEYVGGIAYVASLVDGAIRTSNIGSYEKILKNKFILRVLINIARNILTKAFDQYNEPSDVIQFAENEIKNLNLNLSDNSFQYINEPLLKELMFIESVANNPGLISGVPSGFYELDRLTGGFQKDELTLLAARTSVGKSSMMFNIIFHTAVNLNKSVAVISLEMSKSAVMTRILSCEARIPFSDLKNGLLDAGDWQRLIDTANRIKDAKIHIDDTTGITVWDLLPNLKKIKSIHGLDLIIIDYLQLLKGSNINKNSTREQIIGQIATDLTALAKMLNVPIIALCQLSRATETRTDHRPQLSDLRESGGLEMAADVVMFLYREERYNQVTDDKVGDTEVIVAKQRNGPTDTVNLRFIKEYALFTNKYMEY